MNFALLPGTGELKRVARNDHQYWSDRTLLQAVAFTHPKRGEHVVYLDVALLDAAGIPSPRMYEAVAKLLEAIV